MLKKILLPAVLLLAVNFVFPSISFSQSQLFCVTIGGAGDDGAYSLVATTDGGYVIVGYTNSYGQGNYDAYIVKINSAGSVLWSRTVGGTGDDEATSVIKTADGGYVAAGYTNSFGAGDYDLYVIKLDAGGTVQWTQTVGGALVDVGNGVVESAVDGGITVAGYTDNYGQGGEDAYIVKLNSAGVLQWTRTVGGNGGATGNDNGNAIAYQSADGGYAVAGFTVSWGAGTLDAYILKLTSAGTTVSWTNVRGGVNSENAKSIIRTADGGYAFAGYSNVGATLDDVYLGKINSAGTTQWSRTYGGTRVDHGNSLTQAGDGGYVVAGRYRTTAGDYELYLVKWNSSGTFQWSRAFGGTASEEAYGIVATTDGGYATAGYTFSYGSGSGDIYVIKTGSTGVSCCSSTSPGSSTAPPGGLTTGGATSSGGGAGSGGVSSSGGSQTLQCSLMPVELLYFQANCINGVVKIKWTTASETNNNYFTIERADASLNWKPIDHIIGAGNSNIVLEYEYMDRPSFPSGEGADEFLYYRLKQTDHDGKYEYFGPAAAAVSGCNPEINIFPTVTGGTIFIKGEFENAEICVYSAIGKIIYSASGLTLSASAPIDLSLHPDGIYFLQLTTGGGETTKKFVISH